VYKYEHPKFGKFVAVKVINTYDTTKRS